MFAEMFGADLTKQDSTDSHLGKIVPIPKAPECRDVSNLVGLDNQGATCYLNSLLQAMFFTPELRFGLFKIDPVELGVLLLDEYEREKTENANKGIVEPSESMVEQLKNFGIEEAIARRALVATKNAGVEVAFSYIDEHPEEMKQVKEQQLAGSSELKKKKRKPRLIPLELQRLFVQMQLLNKKSLSTQGT
jgi:uncharacterized UBP type Zn finger protein